MSTLPDPETEPAEPSGPKLCAYRLLDDGIHEMTVMESSKAAVDDLMTHIATVLKTTPEDAPLTRYLIISNEVDAPLLGYMRSQVREVASKRPSNREPGRIAVIYDGLLGGLINTMLRFTLNNELRFFKPQERTAAISWLNQGVV